jgi:K+-transporting ATPase ATPase C chain
LKKLDPANLALIPVDLVTSSASGLDPDISPLAAYYQIPRIAKARGITQEQLRTLIQQQIKTRTFALLGEPRVNVLQLNLALDNHHE